MEKVNMNSTFHYTNAVFEARGTITHTLYTKLQPSFLPMVRVDFKADRLIFNVSFLQVSPT